jgi:transposase
MSIGDENVKAYLFVATLGYSRRLYVRASRNERQESWLAGVEGAFHHVGGITDELLRYQLADARDCTASGRES